MQKKFNRVISLIPARSSSKGIKDKNIKKINGFPLIYYSIMSSFHSKLINETYLFTDSLKYEKIANQYGVKFPFKRDKHNAKDTSSDSDVIKEFLEKYFMYYQYYPDLIVYLRPTQPLRSSKLIDNCIKKFFKLDSRKFTCLRTLRNSPYPPYWMKILKKDIIKKLSINKKNDLSRTRRQDLPKTYICDGYVDIILTKAFLKEKIFPTSKQFGYFDDSIPFLDIDNLSDLSLFEFYLKRNDTNS